MKYYFKLQYDMMNRQLKEMGLHPLFGFFIGLIALIGGTILIYSKTNYAPWVIASVGLVIVLRASEYNRSIHLKSIFDRKTFREIRLIENLVLITPFLIILIFKSELLVFVATLLISIVLSWYESKQSFHFTIPTPFSRKPFEFTTGFRKTILMLAGIYLLFITAIFVGNFNLGIFCLIALFIALLSYYSWPEDKLFVWIHSDNAANFIKHKIKTAFTFSSILAFPIIATLLFIKPSQYFVILTFTVIGLLALITMVIAKYAAFPNKMNIAQGLIFAIGIVLPPLLLGVIPYFYTQAKSNLKELLR